MSLSSDVIEIAERVAAADGHVHLYEQRAVRLIRLLAILSEAEGVRPFRIVLKRRDLESTCAAGWASPERNRELTALPVGSRHP
jgi:hypothetical protein